MKQEFVPYELAIKLKPLGFDKHELCFAHWIERDERDGGGVKLEMWNDEDTYYEVKSLIKAPTFSQAFRWFREKHSWTIDIKQVTKSNWSYTLNNFPKEITYYGELYDTYEEAELACLQKLIKIVETKS